MRRHARRNCLRTIGTDTDITRLKTVEAVLPALPEAPIVSGKLREVAALVEAAR